MISRIDLTPVLILRGKDGDPYTGLFKIHKKSYGGYQL